jgi:FdhD protein
MTQLAEIAVVTTVQSGTVFQREDSLAGETGFALKLNGREVVASVCSPGRLTELMYGYLFTEGLIKPGKQPVVTHEGRGVVNAVVDESAAPPEPQPVRSDYCVTPEFIFRQVKEFTGAGGTFKETGATHSVAISTQDSLRCLVEDVSRSAAFEKAVGCGYQEGIDTGRCVVVLSSRVHSVFVKKSATAGFPIIAAISAPTAKAAADAERLGICLCGFVRGEQMNVYSNRWRLGL